MVPDPREAVNGQSAVISAETAALGTIPTHASNKAGLAGIPEREGWIDR